MKEQEKTVRVRMMTQEKLEQENPQMAAKIRAAAEIEDELLKIPELTLITITHHLTQRERYSQVIAL